MTLDDDPALKARRANSFGAVAAQYDAARPSYPAQLIDDLAAQLPGPDVAEIGAGTGIATRLLQSRGLNVTAIEPDDGMATVLRERSPEIDVVTTSFEAWRPAREYDGLLSAQAWHWTAPDGRWERAARALRPNGLLALWWNGQTLADATLERRATEIYDAHGVAPDARPLERASDKPTGARLDEWPGDELVSTPLFTDVEGRLYHSQRVVSAATLLDYLDTTSHHRVLVGDTARALRTDLECVLGSGELTIDVTTVLYTARKPG